jgi:hypothetical protein
MGYPQGYGRAVHRARNGQTRRLPARAVYAGSEKVPQAPWGLKGDGLLDVRFLHGGDRRDTPDCHFRK